MSLAYIGPVKVDFHGDPSFRWTSDLDPADVRGAEISGLFEFPVAEQLAELANNSDAARTVAGRLGVLVPVWASDRRLAEFVGWYLLEGVDLSPDWKSSLTGEIPTPVHASFLGQAPEIVVSRRSIPKGGGTVFGLSPRSLVVSPFRPEDDAGDRFLVDPGGTFATRAYDPTHPYDPAVPAPAETASIGLYLGTVTDSSDELDTVCLPRLAWSKDAPKWITQQGGMVRARDRRRGREVYGPHTFLESTDLWLGNGHVCFWVGNRGGTPFLNTQVYAGGSWREGGTVVLPAGTLRAAKLVRVTAEDATVALSIDGYGDVFVNLNRGEWRLRFLLPTAGLRPRWQGVPPTTRLHSAANGPGKFGKGLDGGVEQGTWAAPFVNTWAGGNGFSWAGVRSQPDLRLEWPADVDKAAWAQTVWYRPEHAVADLGDAGLVTIYDDEGAAAVQVYVDAADHKIKARMGATTVASAVQTFAAGDLVLIGLSFSTTGGLTLSIRNQVGAVAHVSNPAALDPGTTGRYAEIAYLGSQPIAGDVYTSLYHSAYGGSFGWGDGSAGVTQHPKGVLDNHMIFEDPVSTTEFAELAAASSALDKLPQPEGRLRWFGPFDAAPVVVSTYGSGRQVERYTDELGQQRATVIAEPDSREVAVLLARPSEHDGVIDQQEQFAADHPQSVLVRG